MSVCDSLNQVREVTTTIQIEVLRVWSLARSHAEGVCEMFSGSGDSLFCANFESGLDIG